MMRDRYEY